MGSMRRNIVVDASIARSAGGTEHPVSKMSRQFLLGISEVKHSLVMTREIQSEWKKHRSRFSLQWLAGMQSKGLVRWVDCDSEIGDKIYEATADELFSDRDRLAIEKDVLLVLAALSSDRLIVSRDDKMRELMSQLSYFLVFLRRIIWVNPVVPSEGGVAWVKSGARSDEDRMLWQENRE